MPILQEKYRFKERKLDGEIFNESQRLLGLDGIELKTMTLSRGTAKVEIINRKYLNISQMIEGWCGYSPLQHRQILKSFK